MVKSKRDRRTRWKPSKAPARLRARDSALIDPLSHGHQIRGWTRPYKCKDENMNAPLRLLDPAVVEFGVGFNTHI